MLPCISLQKRHSRYFLMKEYSPKPLALQNVIQLKKKLTDKELRAFRVVVSRIMKEQLKTKPESSSLRFNNSFTECSVMRQNKNSCLGTSSNFEKEGCGTIVSMRNTLHLYFHSIHACTLVSLPDIYIVCLYK